MGDERHVGCLSVGERLPLYVLRTSVPAERLDAPDVVRSYKRLSRVERAFRGFKAADLAIRPIRHGTEDRVRSHVFLCLFAYYVGWHLERAWAPLLFRDEEPADLPDPVAPARRSEAALVKVRTHTLADGTPAHSFRTLLAELVTLTRNLVLPPGAPDEAAFEITTTPTPLQARAFELLGLLAPPVDNPLDGRASPVRLLGQLKGGIEMRPASRPPEPFRAAGEPDPSYGEGSSRGW